MKIDLRKCKTPEEVERAMRPLGEVMAKAQRLLAGDEAGHLDTGPVEVRSEAGSLTIGRLVIHVGEVTAKRRAPRRRSR